MHNGGALQVSEMGNGYLKAYLGNTFKRDICTGVISQHPEFIYASNEEEMDLRLKAWCKSKRSRR
jgi:hypothetical protein